MILVDTCVLSLVLRKKNLEVREEEQIFFFRQMITEDWPLAIPGIVFQEILSGIKSEKEFQKMEEFLEAFPIIFADKKDHTLAARIRNTCLSKGIAASATDSLIAALTLNRSAKLYTFDKDFNLLSKHFPLVLFRYA